MSYISFKDSLLGMPTVNRPVTETLYVSHAGDDSNGSSWEKAYNTIQGALDAASTNANELTLILIGPNTTTYDIDTTGDPTWTGNYEIKGSHRNWAQIENGHAGATSVMKFTGKVSISDVTIDCGAGTNNGVIISGSGTKGSRIRRTYFECEDVTGAQTALEISGGTEYIRLEDVKFHGVAANTTALLLNDVKLSDFMSIEFYDSLIGIQITDVDSDSNRFANLLFHTCALGLDLDAGNVQIFEDLHFFDCTTNADDEVGDHSWANIEGEFPLTFEPDNFTGVNVATGNGADVWTAAPVEIRAAATATKPFRIIGVSTEADASEKFRLRLSADNGITYFDDFQFEGIAAGVNTTSLNFPGGTEFIFNAGTQITAEAKSESVGVDNVAVWLSIQEI